MRKSASASGPGCALRPLVLVSLVAALVCPPSVGAASDDARASRPRHLSFDVRAWDTDGQMGAFERRVDGARARGFDTIGLAFAWSGVEPQPGRFDFDALDERVDYIVESGLRVQLRLTCTRFPDWVTEGSLMRDEDGRVYRGPPLGKGVLAIADPQVREWMARVLSKTAVRYQHRYQDRSPEAPVLFYSVPFGPGMETEYASGAYLDYSDAARAAFRRWLEGIYADVAALNSRWHTHHAAFSDAEVPRATAYGSAAWADWMRYRTDELEGLFSRLARAVHESDPRAKIGVRFAGNAMRVDSGARGTFDVARLVENVDWVVFEDDPSTDPRFAMDVLRSVSHGRRIGREISPARIDHALVAFEYGADLVHLADMDEIARVVAAAEGRATNVAEPRVALYVSTMMQFLHPTCACPGLRDGVMLGVDTEARVKSTYERLSDHRRRPVAILTDGVLTENPDALAYYTDGIYLPTFDRIIADAPYAALRTAGVPLYAEHPDVGTRNEYGEARVPDVFEPYPSSAK